MDRNIRRRARCAPAPPPCKSSPSRGCNLLTADYLWSIAFYTAAIISLIGGYGLFRPLRRVHRGRRTHAATMLLIGLVSMYLIGRAMPRAQTSAGHSGIDEFSPAFHFRERHETVVSAAAARVYEAIRAVLAAPEVAKATMNFRIEPGAGGASKLFTETRVFATDRAALARFTPYSRIIFPGSAILRVTWLRAIKARAERAS